MSKPEDRGEPISEQEQANLKRRRQVSRRSNKQTKGEITKDPKRAGRRSEGEKVAAIPPENR